jgi:aminoglycoside phosphotransferase (APT) family kinase protein
VQNSNASLQLEIEKNMLSIPHQTLEQIVRRVNAGDRLIHADALEGGASAQVILLHVKHPDSVAIKKYLLRAHSGTNRWRNPNIARHEFDVLKTLYDSGLPVAQAHYLDESCEVYPIPYLIIDYIEGATVFSPHDLPDFIQQSAGLLAKIHQVKQPLSALNFLSKRADHVLWWIHYQPEQLDEELDEGRLRDHLRTLFPLKNVNDSTLLHGDFWSGNLIWQHGKLSRVIDWEDAEIGDPLSDLSITRLDVLWEFGKDVMFDFTRRYQALMPGLDYANLPYWDLFSALRQANQLTVWEKLWGESGRPDITHATMQQSYQWFVDQAFKQIE